MFKLTKKHQRELKSWVNDFSNPNSSTFLEFFRPKKNFLTLENIVDLLSIKESKSDKNIFDFTLEKFKDNVKSKSKIKFIFDNSEIELEMKELILESIQDSVDSGEIAIFKIDIELDSKTKFKSIFKLNFSISRKPVLYNSTLVELILATEKIIMNNDEFLSDGEKPLEVFDISNVSWNWENLPERPTITKTKFKKEHIFKLEISDNLRNTYSLTFKNPEEPALLEINNRGKKLFIFMEISSYSYTEDRFIIMDFVTKNEFSSPRITIKAKTYYHGPFQFRISTTMAKYNLLDPVANFLITYKINQMLKMEVDNFSFINILEMKNLGEPLYKLASYILDEEKVKEYISENNVIVLKKNICHHLAKSSFFNRHDNFYLTSFSMRDFKHFNEMTDLVYSDFDF